MPTPHDEKSLQRVPAQGRLLRWLLEAWEVTQVDHRGAYTARRARALERYCHTASRTRVLAVCCLTPLPVLGFVLAMELLPLNPPSDGWRRSSGWIVRYVFIFSLITLSCFQQASSFQTVLNVTLGQALAITWICVSCYFIVLLAIMAVWVFPVPFVFVLTGGIFGVVFVVCVVVVYGGHTLVKTPKLSGQMRVVYSVSGVEGAMCVVYPAFSAAFSALHGVKQLSLLVALFVLKVGFRLAMVTAHGSSKDGEERVRMRARQPELLVFTAGLFHLVYLTMCLQDPHISVWTAATTALIDIATSGLGVYRIVRQPPTALILGSPKHSSVTARRSLSAVVPMAGPTTSALPTDLASISGTASRVASRIITSTSSIKLARRSISRSSRHSMSRSSKRSASRSCTGIAYSQRAEFSERRRTELRNTHEPASDSTRFQTLSRAEYFILIEYVSCTIPAMVGIYSAVLAQLPNAVYYPSLANISSLQLQRSQTNVVVYVILHVASLTAFEVILRHHLQFPVLHQLAFVLEAAAADIQAKFALFIPYCFFFFLEHNGTWLL